MFRATSIKDPRSGLGVFTSKRIGSGEVIGNYYGTLLYENLSVCSINIPAVYGEGMVSVPVSNFMKWALNL